MEVHLVFKGSQIFDYHRRKTLNERCTHKDDDIRKGIKFNDKLNIRLFTVALTPVVTK
jgi:hypothetical protein